MTISPSTIHTGELHIKKRNYHEGDWFAIPLGSGGFAIGLLARTAPKGSFLIGYFFGPQRLEMPTISNVEQLRPNNAILTARFNDVALREGKWPILGRTVEWDRRMWPVPAFGRNMEALAGHSFAYRVEYADDDLSTPVRETRITVEECQNLPSDGWANAGWIEKRLTRLLTAGNDVAPPNVFSTTDTAAIDHFLYFSTKTAATKAAQRLRSAGFDIQVRDSRDLGAGWLTLATRPLPTTAADLYAEETLMETVAATFGGSYDGFERDVPQGKQ